MMEKRELFCDGCGDRMPFDAGIMMGVTLMLGRGPIATDAAFTAYQKTMHVCSECYEKKTLEELNGVSRADMHFYLA